MVARGERKKASGNEILATFVLSGIEPALRKVAKVNVRLYLREDGTLAVTASDEATGFQVPVRKNTANTRGTKNSFSYLGELFSEHVLFRQESRQV